MDIIKLYDLFEKERTIVDYNTITDEIKQTFTQNKEITLATSYNDRVTSRTISFVNKELDIYFMSWEHNKKITQLSKNPKVALTLNNIQIEGVAKVLGSPSKFQEIGDIFRTKFSDRWFETFSKIGEMVLVKVEVKHIVRFENINRRFYLQRVDLENQVVHQMRMEDKTNPQYPY